MLPWNCLVWNLISHIPSVPSLDVSHAINIRPITMKFTRSMLNDSNYTHTKNQSNRKRLSHKFWYWKKRPVLLARSVDTVVITLGTIRQVTCLFLNMFQAIYTYIHVLPLQHYYNNVAKSQSSVSSINIYCPACRTSLIATRFWVVVIGPIIKYLTVLEFYFILFDLCLFITIFNFILNYVPIVTFWIFTYHKI